MNVNDVERQGKSGTHAFRSATKGHASTFLTKEEQMSLKWKKAKFLFSVTWAY